MANHNMTDTHPLAGQTVTIELAGLNTSQFGEGPNTSQFGEGPQEFTVENWWDVLTGNSWMTSEGNLAALIYSLRVGMASLPLDDEVVYGKISGLGILVHASELPAV